MRPVLSPRALNDLGYFIKTRPRTAAKIVDLIADCCKTPFEGLGKPEPLKHDLNGVWSRRIDAEHRLLYRVAGAGNAATVEAISCRLHYSKR